MVGPNAEIWMFIPGPVNVATEVRDAMAQPLINHRGADFKTLYDRLQPKIQNLMQTTGSVFMSTSSAIGIQEAVARNCIAKRSLHLTCGSFSENWHHIAETCGKDADTLPVEWGKANPLKNIAAVFEAWLE